MTLRNAAIAWMVVTATACAGTLDNRDQFLTGDVGDSGAKEAGPGPAPSCGDVPTTVFAPTCGTAGCHASPNPQSGLDLASPNVASRVVDVAGNSGGLLVDRAHPEQSLIYRKLRPGAPGSRMPIGRVLDDATIACVLSWAKSLGGGINVGTPPVDSAAPDAAADAATIESGADAGTVTRVAPGAMAPYTDHQGNVWTADTGFTGGQVTANSPPLPIAKTTDGPLYNSERYGTFRYAFSVPNGSYAITLKFAETYTQITAAGQRQFNVSINGQQVLTNFDIFAEAGGRDTAIDKVFPVNVTNGSVSIAFDPGLIQSPKVDAIAIAPK